jgi:hypothetical protein
LCGGVRWGASREPIKSSVHIDELLKEPRAAGMGAMPR